MSACEDGDKSLEYVVEIMIKKITAILALVVLSTNCTNLLVVVLSTNCTDLHCPTDLILFANLSICVCATNLYPHNYFYVLLYINLGAIFIFFHWLIFFFFGDPAMKWRRAYNFNLCHLSICLLCFIVLFMSPQLLLVFKIMI